MWVKNVKGSSRFDKYNWLRYWEEQTGMTTIRCLAMDCNKQTTELVGAHVQKIYDTDKSWYIVPLCRQCNMRTDIFEIPDSSLVPVPSNLNDIK